MVPAGGGCYWVRYVGRSLLREPITNLEPPLPGEVRRALWKAWAPVASYCTRADELHPANAWLYLCENQDYCVESLNRQGRRDMRRGLRRFSIRFIDNATLLANGASAYCDTQSRLGLAERTVAHFERVCASIRGTRPSKSWGRGRETPWRPT